MSVVAKPTTVPDDGKLDSDLPIDVSPFAPGQLLMTIPAALVLSERQASRLLVRLHDAIGKLKQLDAQHQAELAAGRKNGAGGRKGIARKLRPADGGLLLRLEFQS
jgi:hypothetical protein